MCYCSAFEIILEGRLHACRVNDWPGRSLAWVYIHHYDLMMAHMPVPQMYQFNLQPFSFATPRLGDMLRARLTDPFRGTLQIESAALGEWSLARSAMRCLCYYSTCYPSSRTTRLDSWGLVTTESAHRTLRILPKERNPYHSTVQVAHAFRSPNASAIKAAATVIGDLSVARRLYCAAACVVSITSIRMPMSVILARSLLESSSVLRPVPTINSSSSHRVSPRSTSETSE